MAVVHGGQQEPTAEQALIGAYSLEQQPEKKSSDKEGNE